MDFFENLLGIGNALDGGSGVLEFLLIAIPVAGICCLALQRRFFWKRRGVLVARAGSKPSTAD